MVVSTPYGVMNAALTRRQNRPETFLSRHSINPPQCPARPQSNDDPWPLILLRPGDKVLEAPTVNQEPQQALRAEQCDAWDPTAAARAGRTTGGDC